MNLPAVIESILFVASKPISLGQIAKATGYPRDVVEAALEELNVRYNTDESGIHVLTNGDTVQMATNAAHADAIVSFMKDEIPEELTKAQLETLTVVAYRGPITRPELEQIRGVNCSVILRNLLIRGLVEERDGADTVLATYILSVEALRHLGISSPEALPAYDELRQHDFIEQAVGKGSEE